MRRNRRCKTREVHTYLVGWRGIGKAGTRQQGDSDDRYQAWFHWCWMSM